MPKSSIPFRVAYIPYDLESSPIGSRVRTEFIETVDDKGVKVVVPSGESDIQDEIQACLPDTLIYNILDRVSRGDVSLLDKHPGAYADITGLPTNLHEAYKSVIQAQEFFSTLDPVVKQRFNNNPAEFVASFGSQKFYDVFVPSSAPAVDPQSVKDGVNNE